ncbi:MAG: spore coat protein CotH [Dorea sp.]|nr:spore coat protein CotH [Dorea sp.]
MSTNRHIDKVCIVCITVLLILSLILISLKKAGALPASADMGYESRLFDTSKVHTIDIIMEDWDGFIETCETEEYSACSVVIDDETYKNIGIRAKGNTSLSSVKRYGNNRYSFKIEFDCYNTGISYHGLDKISLNNIIQDNTYMKDYLCYQMMGSFDVAAPLCSYAYITVNGEDWGLYLAVEAVEESFLERNYGNAYGELYKPDSMDMGGGRGNGGKFDGEDFGEREIPESAQMPDPGQPPEGTQIPDPGQPPEGTQLPDRGQLPENVELPQDKNIHDSFEIPIPENTPQNGGIPANDDVSLIYTDDSYESYNNIFDNAKTDITNNDKERLIASLKALNEGENIADIVDTNQVIRYFVVHNFVCNFDSYTGSMIHNYYLYEEDGRMSMIPWDYNLAFGGFESGTGAKGLVNYPIDSPICGGEISSRPMLAWIFENKEYTELYHTYFDEFITEYLGSGIFTEEIDNISQMIAPYVEKDPTKFCTYEEFEAGAETLKKFCLLRAESITGQLNGTIPSTSEEQKANSSALIDADGLNITDMGSMR